MGKGHKLPSEAIEEFLDYMDQLGPEYDLAKELMKKEQDKEPDFLHDFEFARDKAERNRLATELHQSRVCRRKYKDQMQEVEYVINFLRDPINKKYMGALRQLLGNQRKREEYLHGERHYNRKVERKE